MNKMIKNSLVPNLEHSMSINNGFEGVRAECAEGHGKKAKGRGDANEYNHFLFAIYRGLSLQRKS